MGFFVTLLINAALFVLSDLIRPKPDFENAKPKALGDFRVTTATEGRYVPLLWGTVLIDGPNVVWYGDLLQEAIIETVRTGLISKKRFVKGYRYYLGMQQALCMGELDELRRVFIGDDLVVDATSAPLTHGDTFTINEPELFGGEDLGQGGVIGSFEFFAGTSTQAASSYLSDFQKEPAVTGDTPAYRGVAYVAPETSHTLLGTSVSIKGWRWEVRRVPNALGLTSGKHIVAGGANPAAVLYEILTDSDWGYAEATARIDSASFLAAGATLYDEGNGFSFILDRVEALEDLVRRVEEQIDGVLFQNPLTGKWELKLIRADYNVLTVPEINATNLVDLVTFTRGTWEGTSNQVRVPFADAAQDYKDTFGFAQDMANARILGASVSVTIEHPGIKSATLANAIAWRELRTLSTPLALGEFVVDRSLFGVLPGDVVAFTDETLGFSRLPMRVKAVDYGNLLDDEIRIEATQDVFFAAAGSFDDPPGSGWEPPSAQLVAYPTDEQIVFEAPRALTLRDPDTTTPETDKVFAAARRQSSEVSFKMMQRNAAGATSGDYEEFGEVFGFAKIGELQSALPLSSAQPVSSVTVTASPDSQAALNVFPDAVDLVDLGTELLSLCLIDDEFVLVQSSQTSGGAVQLNNVYRGVLDSVQADHSAGASVYLLFTGAALSDSALPAGNNVDVKLLPRAIGSTLAIASATAVSFQLSNRTRRPYPPASFDLNGTTLDTTNVDLDGSGSGEDVGILVDEIVRRDFRTVDEIAALLEDAAAIFPDFPSANTTTVEIEVRDGSNVLASTTGISGTSATMRQLDILAGLDTTTLPASLSIAVRQSHTFDSTVYASRDWLVVEFTVSSDLVGKHAFGELDQAEEGAVYLVQSGDDGTDHAFALSTAFTAGDVEYELDNSASWLTLIAAGNTSGSIPNASLSVGTEIRIRHGSTDTDPQKLLTMTVGGTAEAYAVLIS